MLTILLIVLIVLVLAGGFGYGGGRYRTGGIGLGGVLLAGATGDLGALRLPLATFQATVLADRPR